MKRAVLLVAFLVGATLVPTVAQASPILNTGDIIRVVSKPTSPASAIDGGAFGIDGPDAGPLKPADFMSFCIEMNENVQLSSAVLDNPYYVKISTAAEDGGFAGGNPDPLGEQAAFLYARYVAGLLDDFTSYDGSQASDDALQLAIWTLENEAVKGLDGKYRKNNGNLSAILGAAPLWAQTDELIAAANANIVLGKDYGVRVMQLWKTSLLNLDPKNFDTNKTNDTNAQDMLITVPEAGSSLSVLMFGISALGAARFRFRRTV